MLFVAIAADIVGVHTLELVGQLTNAEDPATLADNTLLVTLVGVAFIVLMVWVTYRGLEGGSHMQQVLVARQLLVLTALAMGVHQALPAKFARVHPTYMTPSYATLMMGAVGTVFYVGFKLISDNLLPDTILSTGLAIALYDGLTAFAAAWCFRRDALLSARDFFVLFLLPLLGGIMLAAVFVTSATDMGAVDYGYPVIFTIGGVFVMGIGSGGRRPSSAARHFTAIPRCSWRSGRRAPNRAGAGVLVPQSSSADITCLMRV